MRRNLYNRVEVVFPVLDKTLQGRVMRILATCLLENQYAWEMLPDGTYQPITPQNGEESLDSQVAFIQDSAGIEAVL